MTLRYQVFGDIAVSTNDGQTTPLRGRQAAVLSLLLVESGKTVSAERIIDEVWGESPPKDPESTLHGVVSRLRAVIGDDLVTTPNGYSLARGPSDVTHFEEAITRARESGDSADFEVAIAAWAAEPYVGMEDLPTVRIEIERLLQSRNRALVEILDSLRIGGHAIEAADRARPMLEAEPFNELILGSYMRAAYEAGLKHEALQAFRRYESHLADETGLVPSAAIRELELGILIDEIDSPIRESRPPSQIDLSIKYIDRSPGQRVAVGRSGSGQELFIHPGWMSRLDWIATGVDMRAPLWSRLAENHEIIVFDRFGTGMSEGDPDDFGFQTSVNELKSVIEQTCQGPVPVWAASGAGPIAIQAAVEAPELISHLILYATYASGPEIFPKTISESMISLIRASWSLGSDVLANMLFPAGSMESREAWNRAARDLASPEVAIQLLSEMYRADVNSILNQVKIPALVIHYQGDKAIPIAGGMNLARAISGAELVTLEGTTHYPLPGEEDRVAGIVERFLAVTAG